MLGTVLRLQCFDLLIEVFLFSAFRVRSAFLQLVNFEFDVSQSVLDLFHVCVARPPSLQLPLRSAEFFGGFLLAILCALAPKGDSLQPTASNFRRSAHSH